jgi:SAM-dependent methyltransferase
VIRGEAVRTLELVDDAVEAGAHRLLDIGTGTGTLGLAAVERWPGVSVIGIDLSPEMAAAAEREADRRLSPGQRHRFATRVAPADRLPFPDATFDVAISSFVLQLVPSRAAALRETRRVLRPGGRLAYVSWLTGEAPYPPDMAFDAVLAELGLEPRRDPGHALDIASPGAAAAGLRRAGFRQTATWGGMLEHRWDAATYLGFLTEFDEEDRFAEMTPGTRRDLTEQLRSRLAAMSADDLILRLPIVRAVGTVPTA